ncbi:hypothetical protein CVU37_04210 [candidate division BRC1 bacterium HGW-BRC1-1]|jgi:hypothetical protein|nr:MAG: hypothetical protein CVU37_04210 [candidate division BRC1 bacterium HGW-BRC1-1]
MSLRANNHRRFSFSAPRRGNALFTMFLFLLLLISCSLMYYYFQRSQRQQRELDIWRAGRTPTQSELASTISTVGDITTAFRDSVTSLPATGMFQSLSGATEAAKLDGAAPSDNFEPPIKEPDPTLARVPDPDATPQPTATPAVPVKTEAAAASETPKPTKPLAVEVPSSAYSPAVEQRRTEEINSRREPPQTAPPPRSTPALRLRSPARTTETPSGPGAVPVTDEIGSMLRGNNRR